MDIIKDSILEQFSGEVTVYMIVFSLLTAFLVSLFIIFVYKKTYSGIVYSRTMPMTFVLLAMITAMIIRTINSNLSLSLGMVGALSIVRFRTAIKDPVDTAFMFWAITAGIMSGAGLYVTAIIGSIALGLLFYLLYVMDVKPKTKYLLVITYQPSATDAINQIMDKISKKNLKSESASHNSMERTYEIQTSKTDQLVQALNSIPGVESVNLVSYQSDFGF